MSELMFLDRYEVLNELGAGGMGTVYLAHDTKLRRDVAIKVLNQEIAQNMGSIARFKREVKVVAGLSHPNVISLYDFVEDGDKHLAVMEYAKGKTLDDFMSDSTLDRQNITQFAVEIASGLSAAHQKGIIHRDIKPANILITESGVVKILDFGLAKDKPPLQLKDDTISAANMNTLDGTILGTLGYMSPEQVVGKPSDARSDIFAFGVVLYEMLTGDRAFKRDSAIETLSATLKEEVQFPASLADDDNDILVTVTRRCLKKDAELRYQDLQEVITEIRQTPPTTISGKRRMSGIAAACLAILAVVLLMSFSLNNSTDIETPHPSGIEAPSNTEYEHARQVLLPEMLTLVEAGDFPAAYQLGERINEFLAEDAVFSSAFNRVSIKFDIDSNPVGASVFVGEYGEDPSVFNEIGVTPISQGVMAPGLKHIVLRLDGFRDRHLLFGGNHVGKHKVIEGDLDAIEDYPNEMVRIVEGNSHTGFISGMRVKGAKTVPEFLIDRYEVTNKDYQEFVDSGAYDNPDVWSDPFVSDGQELTFTEAQKRLVDSTGRPGPSTWEVGKYKAGMEDFPVQGVSWYEARAYARFRNKELPTVYHWSRAAIVPGFDLLAQLVATSNINGESYLKVGEKSVSVYGIADLCGNVAEWLVNSIGSETLSLGGSVEDEEYFFNHLTSIDKFNRDAKRGFRCIRNIAPADIGLAKDLELVLRDYSNVEPISDEVFEVYRSQFDYDDSPLNQETHYSKVDESENYTVERVSFDSSYSSDDRIIAHIYLPKNIKPPYQTVVWFQGAWCIRPVKSEGKLFPGRGQDFIMKSGRVLVIPILKGQWERSDGLRTWRSNESLEYADYLIKWTKDFRRTIDYLETREDIDPNKIGFMGTSWGAFNFPIIGAVEPRLKMSLCVIGGLSMTPARPEVDQISFIHRTKQPTLWLAGEFDPIFPYVESSQIAFNLLGTESSNKRFVQYPTGHNIPTHSLINESLDWLDKYLGPVDKQ